jgi:hypothetical protein
VLGGVALLVAMSNEPLAGALFLVAAVLLIGAAVAGVAGAFGFAGDRRVMNAVTALIGICWGVLGIALLAG